MENAESESLRGLQEWTVEAYLGVLNLFFLALTLAFMISLACILSRCINEIGLIRDDLLRETSRMRNLGPDGTRQYSERQKATEIQAPSLRAGDLADLKSDA